MKTMSFEEAKKVINGIGLKPKTEKEAQEMYEKWWDANKEYCESIGLPRNPQEVYGK